MSPTSSRARPNIDPAVAAARARLAGLTSNRAEPARLETARRDLAAETLADYIRRTVAEAPPLTAEQVARLRFLLHPEPGRASE